MLLLAACATPPAIPAPPLAPMMTASATAAAAAAAPAPIATVPPAAIPASMMPLAPLGPPTDSVSLRAVYGAPDFVRRETDSELWRYDGMGCAAFFFLYREGEIWRLRYSETNPRGRAMPADTACLTGLSARRARMS